MNKADIIFKENIQRILDEGTLDENPRPKYKDGTPAHTQYITQVFEEYDLSKGELPLTTLRPIGWKSAIKEILWIYQDQTSSLEVLEEKHKIQWWREWNIGDMSIGQRYGATVRRYDLMNRLIEGLKQDAYSRRHILSLWQEKDLNETEGLYPCAFQTIFSVRKVKGDLYLDATLIQRSSDYLVAGHVNLVQYVALQMMIAHEVGMKVGKFARFTQNLHIYSRHIEQAQELLSRPIAEASPNLILNAGSKPFYDITINDFELSGYEPIKPQLQFELGI